jgi:hypothetical protein
VVLEATEFLIDRPARLTSVLDTDERPDKNYNSARTSIRTHSGIPRENFLMTMCSHPAVSNLPEVWIVFSPKAGRICAASMKSFLALASLLLGMTAVIFAAETNSAIFQAGNRILFQGDSITDGNRGRNNDPNHVLGHSYAFLVAAKFGALLPERNLTFFNRGISGNKVPDLAARWQQDTIELNPPWSAS